MKQICGANILPKTSRSDDALFFSADGDLRFNFLDYEAQTSSLEFIENLVSLLVDIASIKKRAQRCPPLILWLADEISCN
jgi:predicted ATP-grasp superfamily ATP-dependent carboligase